MRLQLLTLAPQLLLLLLALHTSRQLAHAYPPSYSDEPAAVVETGSGAGKGGSAKGTNTAAVSDGYALLPLKHKPQQKQPTTTTYHTIASTTASTTAAASSPSHAPLTSGTPMQAAFVYQAAVPPHTELTNDKKVPHTAEKLTAATPDPHSYQDDAGDSLNAEKDDELSKKIIGSSVVTSVSVVLNGNEEPEYADALGHRVPKPQPSLQVASPINLLNPDRYEFYTFDDNGELVKRLMTMQEIQSIVANGDGDGPSIIHTAVIDERDPEKNVQDIVDSVQNVLNKEVESSKNATLPETLPVLDTPDVSSSWSMILPAIFGNAGGDIFPQQKPQQIVMTPDSELLETSTKAPAPTRSTKKPKPSKRKPAQKRKTSTTTTTEMPPQIVQEELAPEESVYTGMQQYQSIASNMQNFDGFSQLHMQPIYHKLPEASTTSTTTTTVSSSSATPPVEATTKRIFVNNQELIQTEVRPSANKTTTEHLGKKPIGVHPKPGQHTPPHLNKKPSGATSGTKRPQTTHNKQKIKKKPTTTTTTPAPEPETTTTTSTTTTTTTTPAPTTTTPAPETTTPEGTTVAPTPTAPTTPKKKKKKPTRKPGQHSTGGIGSSKPHQTGEKRKPARPTAVANHKHRPTATSTSPESNHKHRPTATPISPESNKKHTSVHDQTAASTSQQGHHKQRPRPHKPHKTSAAATTTTTTTTTEVTPGLIVQEFPGYAPYFTAAPLPPTTGSPPSTSPSTTTTTSTTTPKPHIASSTSGYPMPLYGLYTEDPVSIEEETDYNQLKKQPLPSLAMIQQHKYTTQPPNVPPAVEDLPAIISIDQLMQSLKQDEKDQQEKEAQKTSGETVTAPNMPPMEYNSAESMEQIEQLAVQKKRPVVLNTPEPEVSSYLTTSKATTTTSKPTIVTSTTAPITAPKPSTTDSSFFHNYGGSTLATLLMDEEDLAMTSRPLASEKSTDSSAIDETTLASEENTPIVLITQRPHFFATTKKPEETTTDFPYKTDAFETDDDKSDSTELPNYTDQRPVGSTEKVLLTVSTSNKQTAEHTHDVLHFVPLYADVGEPIITELSTTTELPQSTVAYNENSEDAESTFAPLLDEITTQTDDAHYTTLMQPGAARLPVLRPQKVESTQLEGETTELPPLVADLKPNLNMEVIKPTDQINMSEFQTQAATVASTLVDGVNSQNADTFMSSNETKTELEFLMSDVLHQFADQEGANRLTNYAQLNSSFLLKPGSGATKTPTTESSNESSGYGVATAASSNEVPRPQKPEQAHNKIDSTTLIPSKEEIIQKEQEYLNTLKGYEIPKVETTTFRVPVLSLSEIYTQQQTDQEKMHFLYENRKTTAPPVTASYASPTPAGESERVQETEEDVDTNKEEATTSKEAQESEMSTESDMESDEPLKESPEKEADEKETSADVYVAPASTEKLRPAPTYATMINAPENSAADTTAETQIAEATNGLQKLQAVVVSSTETSAAESQSTEKGYATMINTDRLTTTSTDQAPYIDDNKNAEQPVKVTADRNEPEAPAEETTESVETSGSLEESTESTQPAVESTVMLSESDMEGSSEQKTAAYETDVTENAYAKPENIDESTEALSAIIEDEEEVEEAETHEDETKSSAEVDPYIKLGETISKPEAQATKIIPETVTSEDKEVIIPPSMSYSGQADEEDEEDQGFYQPPSISILATTKTTSTTTTTTTPKPSSTTTRRLNTLKPVSYFKQPAPPTSYNNLAEVQKPITYTATDTSQRPMQRPAALNNLMATSSLATRPPVKLAPSPAHSKGLEASTANLDEDVLQFARLCNELAFSYWKSITSEKISSARSLVISPFALTSMLSMVFLGARGGTSGEMNEVLKLDDMVTFNPHLIFKNITDAVEHATDSDIATTAFVREIFSDRANGKILPFFKEKVQQLYAGHVEEVNFHVVNDIIRRRSNLLVKRHTMGKVLEYLRTNSVWVNGPLATISANLFQTDCTRGSTHERDGEMFFQVHPTVRQRRLVPVPAVLYKSGFTAGYEPKLDATLVAFGRIEDTVSTIYIMPGHQSSVSAADNLDRLERELVERAFSENAWGDLLTALMDHPDMEVQLPRFSHRSFVNASLGLQKMGLKGLFKSDFADLRGLTGSPNRDIFLSDMIQINTFSTCGEEKISDHHHVEMYPAPPLRKRNKDVDAREDDELDSSEAIIDFGSLVQDSVLGRGFYDDLLDPKYLELPLPLRPRQARVPDAPRLRFDKPFLYFVRHNPTGMLLFMGRFNPRLLP